MTVASSPFGATYLSAPRLRTRHVSAQGEIVRAREHRKTPRGIQIAAFFRALIDQRPREFTRSAHTWIVAIQTSNTSKRLSLLRVFASRSRCKNSVGLNAVPLRSIWPTIGKRQGRMIWNAASQPTDIAANGHRRSTEVLILIFTDILWNIASESRPHGIPKKFRCGHWTKSHCAIDDEFLVVFFDNIETFQLVTLNFSPPSQ